MRTLIKLTLAVALVAVVASPSWAVCTFPTPIVNITPAGQSTFVNPASFGDAASTYGYTFSFQGPAFTSAANAIFWRAGSGDTTDGLGDDSGTFGAIANGNVYSYYYAAYYGWYAGDMFNLSWTLPGIDGCIFPGGVGTGFDCTCMLFSDQVNGSGQFALMGVQATATAQTEFVFPGTDAAGQPGADVVFADIPAPTITGTTRLANNDVQVTLNVPMMTDGVYILDGCPCGPTGYKVLQQIVARGGAIDMNRDAALFEEVSMPGGGAQPVTPLGSSVTVESACGASDTDVYFVTQLYVDSGFATSTVSGNAVRMECGPTLANPNDAVTPEQIRPVNGDRLQKKPDPRGRR